MGFIEDALGREVSAAGVVIIAIAVALVLHAIVYAIARRVAARTESSLDESMLRHTRNPARMLFSVAAVFLALPWIAVDQDVLQIVREVNLVVGILALGWLGIALTRVGYDAVMSRFPADVEDDQRARQMETQLSILQRMGSIVIGLLAVALAALTIPGIQPLAASLLASAGILGIVLGVAAGPVLGNVIAGIQIAFAQPIRLDDMVKIGDIGGRVEKIATTYVILRIWDQRRLIVPLSEVIKSPLENWTREGTNLTGAVTLNVDYRTPIEELRTECKRILDGSELWDGESWGFQVTDATDTTIVVRAVMSAHDAGGAWNLRCLVREQLVAFLQEKHPESLPVVRRIGYEGGPQPGMVATSSN